LTNKTVSPLLRPPHDFDCLFVNQSDGMDLKEERQFYLSIKVMGQSKSWGGLKRGETVLFVNQSQWVALKE
jgi:hypothetical protein